MTKTPTPTMIDAAARELYARYMPRPDPHFGYHPSDAQVADGRGRWDAGEVRADERHRFTEDATAALRAAARVVGGPPAPCGSVRP